MGKIVTQLIEIPKTEHNHSHDFAQIVIPLEGTEFIQTEHADFMIDETSLVYLPPNTHHKFHSKSGNPSLVINIPSHMIKKIDMSKDESAIHLFRDEKIKLLVNLILLEYEENTSSESIKYLYFYLYDKIFEKKTSSSIDYISKHYDEHIAITDLADMEHYNVNYYREWFKKQTGMRPKDYIQKLRIEKAKELLLTTGYSISEIAKQVGYDHSSSFCRAFKLIENSNPNLYRRQNK